MPPLGRQPAGVSLPTAGAAGQPSKLALPLPRPHCYLPAAAPVCGSGLHAAAAAAAAAGRLMGPLADSDILAAHRSHPAGVTQSPEALLIHIDSCNNLRSSIRKERARCAKSFAASASPYVCEGTALPALIFFRGERSL